MATLAQSVVRPCLPTAARRSVSRPARRVFICKAAQEQKRWGVEKMALPLATAVAAALISGAIVPEEALAAKSGGRAGGSGFQSRRAAPAAQSTTTSTTVVNNYVSAPPVYGGGWGFGGFSIMPAFYMPVPFAGFGTILSLFLVVALVGAVFNVVSSMGSKNSSNKTNDWDN